MNKERRYEKPKHENCTNGWTLLNRHTSKMQEECVPVLLKITPLIHQAAFNLQILAQSRKAQKNPELSTLLLPSYAVYQSSQPHSKVTRLKPTKNQTNHRYPNNRTKRQQKIKENRLTRIPL